MTDFTSIVYGVPNKRHLRKALELWHQAFHHLLQSEYGSDGTVLQYGPALGSGRFRTEVAKFLSHQYADHVSPEHVIQTGSASQGLTMACMLLLPAGATVYVEDPTFFVAINVLSKDLRLNVVPVATDERGIKVDELQRLMESHERSCDAQSFTCMVYVIPTYNNPKGICYSKDRCEALVRLTRDHNALLFCDDVYNMLHYAEDSRAPPRLLTYDNKSDKDYKGHVISNGTFSKILGPGLRVGWIETSERIVNLISQSWFLDSGGCVNHFSGEVMSEVLSRGLLEQHLCMLRQDYGRTVTWVSAMLRERLPECSFHSPQGGFVIWLELPPDSEATEVAKIAKEELQLLILPGEISSPTRSFRNYIRVNFACLEEDALMEAIGKLCEAIRRYLNPGSNTAN